MRVDNILEQNKLMLVVSATFTIELIETALDFWMKRFHKRAEIVFAPYNQVFQELLNPDSSFMRNKKGVNIVFLRFEDWMSNSNTMHKQTLSDYDFEKMKKTSDEFIEAVRIASKKTATPLLIVTCPFSDEIVGNEKSNIKAEKLEKEFIKIADKISNVYTVSYRDILKVYPVEVYYEQLGEEIGHIPFTAPFFTAMGTMVSRKIFSILTKPFKAIAMDCDNTLWDGIVGEDGPEGIIISEKRRWLQKFLIEQYNAGMILCLCSKNNERDVWEIFDNNAHMLLKHNHISDAEINWNPKSENLLLLAKNLNIGIDSFIFIDDSPIECAEVKAMLPEVMTIQIPEKLEDMKRILTHNWAFDHLKVTKEDKKRTKFYKDAKKRDKLLHDTQDFSSFIKELNIKIEIRRLKEDDIARASQLTQRVNQFNLTTKRRTEGEIESLVQSNLHDCFAVHVRDRFGDYGLVGLIIAEIKSECYEIDSMLLSCRALGRGAEHKMLSYVGSIAKKQNLKMVKVPYIPTSKNIPARDFLVFVAEQYGRETSEGFLYEAPVSVAEKTEFNPADKKTIETKKSIKSMDEAEKSTKKRTAQSDKINVLKDISHNLTTVDEIQKEIKKQKGIKKRGTGHDGFQFDETMGKIKDVWSDILDIEAISPNDKFFEIGGKSIQIPLIVIQLKKKYGMNVSIVETLQYPTISLLSKFIKNRGSNVPDTKTRIDTIKQKNAIQKQKQRALKAKERMQGRLIK